MTIVWAVHKLYFYSKCLIVWSSSVHSQIWQMTNGDRKSPPHTTARYISFHHEIFLPYHILCRCHIKIYLISFRIYFWCHKRYISCPHKILLACHTLCRCHIFLISNRVYFQCHKEYISLQNFFFPSHITLSRLSPDVILFS